MTRLLGVSAVALISAVTLAACGGGAYGGGSSTGGSSTGGAYGGGSAGGSSTGGSSTGGAASTSSGGATAAATVIRTGKGSLGSFLVDGGGRSLYLWNADHGSRSVCDGACAQAWPPLTATGTPKAGAGVKASLLGTTMRADGTREVTYAGHPLYHFSGDAQAGQTAGQGSGSFGAPWWLVSPAGRALQG